MAVAQTRQGGPKTWRIPKHPVEDEIRKHPPLLFQGRGSIAPARSAKPWPWRAPCAVRMWSTVLNGMNYDYAAFTAEIDRMRAAAAR
ncbi:MAG: hypothetical protein ACU0AT_00850 [Tranquillimonas sp.]